MSIEQVRASLVQRIRKDTLSLKIVLDADLASKINEIDQKIILSKLSGKDSKFIGDETVDEESLQLEKDLLLGADNVLELVFRRCVEEEYKNALTECASPRDVFDMLAEKIFVHAKSGMDVVSMVWQDTCSLISTVEADIVYVNVMKWLGEGAVNVFPTRGSAGR